MQPSIGVFIDWTFVVIATVLLVCLVVFFGLKRGEKGVRFWVFALGEILISFIIWQVLFVIIRFYTYTGGPADLIFLKHAISNVAAYLIVITILIYVERKRS